MVTDGGKVFEPRDLAFDVLHLRPRLRIDDGPKRHGERVELHHFVFEDIGALESRHEGSSGRALC